MSRGKENRRSRWRERDGEAEQSKVNKLLITGEWFKKTTTNKPIDNI